MTRIWKLPMPPSTNGLTRNVSEKERAVAARRGKKLPGRVKTRDYDAWIQEAGLMLLSQGPRRMHEGHFLLAITLFAPTEGSHIDADNVKAVADLLQRHGLIQNDKLMAALMVAWAPGPKACHVAIHPYDNPWENPDVPQAL